MNSCRHAVRAAESISGCEMSPPNEMLNPIDSLKSIEAVAELPRIDFRLGEAELRVHIERFTHLIRLQRVRLRKIGLRYHVAYQCKDRAPVSVGSKDTDARGSFSIPIKRI